MKKGKYILGILVLGLALSGCKVGTKTGKTESETKTTKEETKQEYVHGDTGYFSLIDEGYGTVPKMQEGGTCWVNSAATSMEYSFKLNGKDIEVDPMVLLEDVFAEDKEEGYFPIANTNIVQFGGYTWQVCDALANGFDDKYILKDAHNLDGFDDEDLKECVKKYGGVTVSINDTKGFLFGMFDGYFTLNDSDSDTFDHGVVLIGWDDNFPKEYFKKPASQNGAWLCQNSHGDFWGNNGCYWVSYDMELPDRVIVNATDEYERIVSYDAGNKANIEKDDIKTAANVFRNQEGVLKGIGTYMADVDEKIKVTIYDADFNEILYENEYSFDTPGYHTMELNEEFTAEDYAVSVTYEQRIPVEGDYDVEELSENCGIEFKATSEKGQSFVKIGDDWFDLNDKETLKKIGFDKPANNACIKVVY